MFWMDLFKSSRVPFVGKGSSPNKSIKRVQPNAQTSLAFAMEARSCLSGFEASSAKLSGG